MKPTTSSRSKKHKKNANGKFTLKINEVEQVYEQYQYIHKVPAGGLMSAGKHIGPGDSDIDAIYISYPNAVVVDKEYNWTYPDDVIGLPEKWALHYQGVRYIAITGKQTATFKKLHKHITGHVSFDGKEENGTKTIKVSGDFELTTDP
ncbi:hypothetical protein [Pseudomonas sp. S3_H04]